MTKNHEIHQRAGNLADLATSMLVADGVKNAAVVVTYGAWCRHPLAIRTPSDDGFGAGTKKFFNEQQRLLWEAYRQAEYQLTTGGRTASQQEAKLTQTKRNAASYDWLLTGVVRARYAHDKSFGLTMVVSSGEVDALDAAKLAEEAMAKYDKGVAITRLPAVELVHACLDGLLAQLPEDRTGFAMIGSPICRVDSLNMSESGPVIICSQSVGGAVEPANYAVVSAKARAVPMTSVASGRADEWYPNASRIPGAIPVEIKNRGQRVLAAGGLPNGDDDVEVLVKAMNSFASEIQVRQVESLKRW